MRNSPLLKLSLKEVSQVNPKRSLLKLCQLKNSIKKLHTATILQRVINKFSTKKKIKIQLSTALGTQMELRLRSCALKMQGKRLLD